MVNRKKVMEELLCNLHAMRHKLMVGYTGKKDRAITPSQGFVLRFIAEQGNTNVKAIAQSLHITSSAATQLVDGLADNGYLVRTDNPSDRRVIALSLSTKAKKLFKEFEEQSQEKMKKLFSVLTDEELVQYAAINKKIASNITNTI